MERTMAVFVEHGLRLPGSDWEAAHRPAADVYWDVLAEVAGERLDDLRRDHADGAKDTWDALVHAMSTQGLTLTQSKDEKGLTRVTIQ